MFLFDAASIIMMHTGGHRRHIAVEDPDVSFDIKSSGSPYGFQHCKSLVSFADLCVDVFVKVFSCKDYASTVCELLNVL